jgi:hypothetical protein
MKIIKQIIWLPALMSLFFISCGDNDDPLPEKIPVQKKITYSHEYELEGLSKSAGVYFRDTIYLADIIGESAADKLIKADFHIAESYLEVTGLKALSPSPILRSFSLQLENGSSILFDNCTSNPQSINDLASDTKQSTPKVSEFIKSVFSTYTSDKKKAVIKISYESTEDFMNENVYLTIVFTGTYNYYTYK